MFFFGSCSVYSFNLQTVAVTPSSTLVDSCGSIQVLHSHTALNYRISGTLTNDTGCLIEGQGLQFINCFLKGAYPWRLYNDCTYRELVSLNASASKKHWL